MPLQKQAPLRERRSNVSSDTLARVRAEILDGSLAPGEKLNLEQLRAAFNVSLSPLREALSRLRSEGLVVQDQRGFQVAPVSRENFEEVMNLRKTMEVMALRQAIARGDDAWEAEIVSSLHRLSKLSSRRADDRHSVNEEWEQWHRRYHAALITGCKSPVLLQICDMLHDLSDRYRRMFLRPTPVPRDVASEHRAIAEATLARDADKACALMQAHIALTGSLIQPALAETA